MVPCERSRLLPLTDWIADFLTALKTNGEDAIAPFLHSTSIAPQTLDAHIAFPASGYSRKRLAQTGDMEIALLCWSHDARTPIHDHGGVGCWTAAQLGSFSVTSFSLQSLDLDSGRASLAIAQSQEAIVEEIDRDCRTMIHRVSVSPDCERAVSVHVYRNPICDYLEYDFERSRVARKSMLAGDAR